MKKINFDKLLDESYDYLNKIQELCKKQYKIDLHEHWHYYEDTGIFKFYTGDDEMYFKYQVVGSFSNNTNTWLWSWANQNIPEISKYQIRKILAFGEENNIKELNEGHCDADEIYGWEMTAIVSKILKPSGVYRVPVDHLLIYCILTEPITKEEVAEINANYVDCGAHGKNRRAFICSHLNKEYKTGFHESFQTKEKELLKLEEDYQAWCDKCETIRLKNNGWNDKSMTYADIKVVCKSCYFEIKDINRK